MAVLSVVEKYGVSGRITLQSFDWRVLEAVKDLDPSITLACLTARDLKIDGASFNLQPRQTGASPWLTGHDHDDYPDVATLVQAFGASILSPRYRDINRRDVEKAHALGLKVIPWTINDPAVMHRFIDWGVDGIITDRPDLLKEILEERNIPWR